LFRRSSRVVQWALVAVVNCAVRFGAPKHLGNGLREFSQTALAGPQLLFRVFPRADIADETGKYLMTVSGQFTKGDFHRKFLASFPQPGEFRALPVDVPLASSQVAPETTIMQFAHPLRH